MAKPGRLGVGVIGAGKVGAVFGAALRAAEHAVVGVHAVSEESGNVPRRCCPASRAGVPEIVRRAELVLLAVPDDALGRSSRGWPMPGTGSGPVVVHTAGRSATGSWLRRAAAGAIPWRSTRR